MEYVVSREINAGERLTLYRVAEIMAYADSNDHGYVELHDIEETIGGHWERFLFDERRGALCLTDHKGITKPVDEIISSIPREWLEPDEHGHIRAEENLEIYTYLPMLNDWGRSYGYTFVFAQNPNEVSRINMNEMITLGRKTDSTLPSPPNNATFHEAAKWLTEVSGVHWTERSVLEKLYFLAETCNCRESSEVLTGAEFVVPVGTVFGSYYGLPKHLGELRGLHKLDRLRKFTGYTLALSETYAKALLKKGRVDVDIVLNNEKGFCVAVEPPGETISLTIDKLRISADRLMGLYCISQGKESRLMPIENAYAFSRFGYRDNLFVLSYEERSNATWHALSDTAAEYGWSCEETSYLLDNPDRQSTRPEIDLLRVFRTRPLGSFYADVIKQYLADESVSLDDQSEGMAEVDANNLIGNPTPEFNNMELREKTSSCDRDDIDPVKKLAELFDSVSIQSIAKTFPIDEEKWVKWAERASNNGLKTARTSRAKFNPYLVAVWLMTTGESGWDWAYLNRKLANNLPPRSRDQRHLLADELNDY